MGRHRPSLDPRLRGDDDLPAEPGRGPTMACMSPALAATLADAVLALHAGIVAFVVLGLPAIAIGQARGWRWVRGWTFRLAHLGAIGYVAAQAWLGIDCPLTVLELALRRDAGQAGLHAQGFVAHWLARGLYWDLPPWAFTTAYTAFALAVAAAWWRWPPGTRPAR